LLEDSTAAARFQREIKNAVEIEHPHIVPVYSAGYEDGVFYLAMRYVRGPDLWEVVSAEGPLPEPRTMRLVGQLASALFSCHEQSIVHRDVKPQNVLLWNAGAPDEHAFLTDFGIAKALNDAVRITRFGALGTPGYMAPELLNGEAASPASDQFALACLAFELLTGHLPFGEPDASDTQDVQEFPLPLTVYAPGVSTRVRETIERALSPEPDERFPDVRAFVTADEAAHEAFERSNAISETVGKVRGQSELVTGLALEHGLSDARIAEIADLKKSQVVRLRRQAARRFVIGESQSV
jgi:serine/threonine-protein kinase